MASWAANPAIVKAIKHANGHGPIPMMGNAKWREPKETDPIVTGFITNPTGQMLTKWMSADPKGINKIVLSGNKGQTRCIHLHAGYLYRQGYIGKGKPNFDAAFEDTVWNQPQTKPDPGTEIDTVQVAAPVKDGDDVIGVLTGQLDRRQSPTINKPEEAP